MIILLKYFSDKIKVKKYLKHNFPEMKQQEQRLDINDICVSSTILGKTHFLTKKENKTIYYQLLWKK